MYQNINEYKYIHILYISCKFDSYLFGNEIAIDCLIS